ncbi:hypothetical protein MMC08_000005 [Hypocenomyce scalaris]|nr:hypothetical protein [Hypocenomyce scalaris]
MEPDIKSSFAIHEAAREGRSISASQWKLLYQLTSASPASAVESYINANPRLATRPDDDNRLPIHWAVSYNQLDTVKFLASLESFDPDVQDGSGWTPLMMAASLREGDEIVDLLLNREADVNFKSKFAGERQLRSGPENNEATL